MLSLAKSLLEEPGFKTLVKDIETGNCPAVLSGLSEIHRAHAAAAIRAVMMRPVVLVCAGDDEIESIKDNTMPAGLSYQIPANFARAAASRSSKD